MSLADLQEDMAAESRAVAGLALGGDVPLAVAAYIKVGGAPRRRCTCRAARLAPCLARVPCVRFARRTHPHACPLQVLEASVRDTEDRCAALQRDALACADSERRARASLAAARGEAAAAERALQQQTRRLQALEGLRLQDVQVRGPRRGRPLAGRPGVGVRQRLALQLASSAHAAGARSRRHLQIMRTATP